MALFGTRKKRNPWMVAPEPPAYQGGYDLTDQDLTPQSTTPSTIPTTPQNPEPQGMMGGRRPGFWGGGDKFTARDGIAAALAVVGDAFSNRAGMPVGATQMLAGGRMDALEQARAAQEQQAQYAAKFQRAKALGYDDATADVLASGDAKFSDIYQKPSTDMQNFGAYQNMSPDERRAYGAFKDVQNPIITNTYDGQAFTPRAAIPQAWGGAPGGLPPGYSADEWEVVEGPPAGGGGANTPSDAQTMERLYIQQFGEAQGRPMFEEWLRLTRRGGR